MLTDDSKPCVCCHVFSRSLGPCFSFDFDDQLSPTRSLSGQAPAVAGGESDGDRPNHVLTLAEVYDEIDNGWLEGGWGTSTRLSRPLAVFKTSYTSGDPVVDAMSNEQLAAAKRIVKKALRSFEKSFERIHHGQPGKDAKQPVKELYKLHKHLKEYIASK